MLHASVTGQWPASWNAGRQHAGKSGSYLECCWHLNFNIIFQNFPFPWGSGLHLIYGSMGPHESALYLVS